jgi:hypothetical protein
MRHRTSSIRANLAFILDGAAMTTAQDALDEYLMTIGGSATGAAARAA